MGAYLRAKGEGGLPDFPATRLHLPCTPPPPQARLCLVTILTTEQESPVGILGSRPPSMRSALADARWPARVVYWHPRPKLRPKRYTLYSHRARELTAAALMRRAQFLSRVGMDRMRQHYLRAARSFDGVAQALRDFGDALSTAGAPPPAEPFHHHGEGRERG